ncbi:hypothetical protein MIND_00798600 [Mycena indigotica]|uniref:Uncharacterized protein n=1 Tax=Mycena indigotica TaxID=2126181 RepID=A0A8H6SFA4_9AGAR|nr:uncharacterized protein MIND_00798600 [Mycena indigotica]KAF7298520.1 hypothetical protein MIND_00798600 [Mycena indigotica]
MLLLLALASTRAARNDCTDITSCRTLSDIVWGCLATIFLRIWVSVHPNVPPPLPEQTKNLNATRLRTVLARNGQLLHRVKLMAVALAAPEIMIGFAARQFLMARFCARGGGLRDDKNDLLTITEYSMTLTNGFFFIMGGFSQLSAPDVLKAIGGINQADIEDKSKGDISSKGIALFQGLWFIAQCIARVPLTELEIATLAFATINALIWLLWLEKLLDAYHTPRFQRFAADAYDALSNTAVPTFWCAVTRRPDGLRLRLSALNHRRRRPIHFRRVISPYLAPSIAPHGNQSSPPPPSSGCGASLPSMEMFSAYAVARTVLLALPFSTLRALPAAAFRDVDWSPSIGRSRKISESSIAADLDRPGRGYLDGFREA